MNRPLIFALSAGAALVAALVVFQAPDTGDDVPELEIKPVDIPTPLPPPPSEPAAAAVKKPVPQHHNDAQQEIEARRALPDATTAGTQGATWTGIRREFINAGGDQALATEMSDLVRSLRDARRKPDDADFADLAAKQADIRGRIVASGNTSDLMQELFTRLDSL